MTRPDFKLLSIGGALCLVGALLFAPLLQAQTIPQLPAGTTPTGTEPLAVYQGGKTVKVTTAQVATSPTITTALPAASTLTGSELIPGVQSGGAVKVTAGAIAGLTALTPQQFGAVGNGTTDDTTAINALFTAAAGKVVDLGAGYTYAISAAVNLPSNITVRGTSAFKETTASAQVLGSGVTGVRLSQFEINGNAAALGLVLNYGVVFSGGSNNWADGLYIHDTNQACIEVLNESHDKILRNRATNCGRNTGTDNHGIMVGTTTAATTDNEIAGNTVTGTYRKSIAVFDFTPGTNAGYRVHDNETTGGGLAGIYVSAAPGLMSDIIVAHNRASANYVNFEFDGVNGGAFTGNVGDGTTGGVNLNMTDDQNDAVISNTLLSAQTNGISVTVSSLTTNSNLNISDNVVALSGQATTNTYNAILLSATINSSVSDNELIGEAVSPKQANGVSESGASDYNTIVDNTILNVATGQVALVGAHTTSRLISSGSTILAGPIAATTGTFTSVVSPPATNLPINAGSGGAVQIENGVLIAAPTGEITMAYLPTADPHVVGALWNSSGTLKVSAG